MRSHDLAIDRPDEGRQLAGNRRGDDGRPLALPGERPKAPAQPHLRFPGNLAHRPRCGRLARSPFLAKSNRSRCSFVKGTKAPVGLPEERAQCYIELGLAENYCPDQMMVPLP